MYTKLHLTGFCRGSKVHNSNMRVVSKQKLLIQKSLGIDFEWFVFMGSKRYSDQIKEPSSCEIPCDHTSGGNGNSLKSEAK